MKRSAAFILVCLLCSFVVQAQPKANFTADVTSGCAPILVNFQNLSTGVDNATKYIWDLGNGSSPSNLKNPSAVYLNPGVHRVSLTVITSGGRDSLTRDAYISVYAKPQLAFDANIRTGCTPTTIQFHDLSTAASGTTNASWNWDFGDGTSSNEQNPAHIYNTPGTYSITLNVTSDKGCSNLLSQSNYITIVQGVKPQFTNTQQTVCKPPSKVSFTNKSTGPGTLNYVWDFGNGQTSTRKNPSTSYTTPGSFPVKLVVRSSFGCADSVLVLNAVIISSTQINTNFHVPPVCSNTAVQLLDSSSAIAVSRLWKFSDGTTDSVANPVKTFTTSGSYTITLLNNYGTCTDSVSKTLQIGPKPNASFKATTRNSCQLPLAVTFTNTTTNGSSYQWNFGDGTVSSDTMPAHTYTINGSFPVSLIATNAAGCADTIIKPAYVNIQTPVVYFKKLPERGCLPYVTQFFDSAISADRIVSYKWNLGDGTTSTAKAPSHTYRKQGTYPVSLTIKTATGCTASGTIPNGVKVGTKPGTIDFSYDHDTVCASQAILFKDQSAKVDEWEWSFGDGTGSNVQDPAHLFVNIGQDTVKLTAYNSGCKGKPVKKLVTIKAPIAIFSYRLVSCTDRLTYSFINSSLTGGSANLTWKWTFGDGTTSDQQNPPAHTYAALGSYPVTLFVTNGECSYNAAQTITILPRTTDFTANVRAGCKPFTPVLTPSDLGNPQIVSYTWNFGDVTSGISVGAIPHSYGFTGDYDVSLITTDIYGCKDTSALKSKYFRVNGPLAKFTAANPTGCKGLTTTFIDSSKTDGQNALANWQWDFGDSTQQAFTAPPFDHTYKNTGQFTVKLTVQDAAGCRDSILYPNYVRTSDLQADWTGVQRTCPGAPVPLTTTVNSIAYKSFWDFGNGTTSTEATPTITYADTGLYTIKLIVTDSLGCQDSVIKTDYTKVGRPKASFTENNLTSYCIPFQAVFANTSTYIDSSFWDLGVSTSTQINPVSYYTKIGSYPIRLRVTSPGGCTDSLTKMLNVHDINAAKLTYATTSGCRPIKVDFDAFTDLKGRFIWDFGDGTVTDTTYYKISHTYENSGSFVPKIILQEPAGCVVALKGTTPISVNGARVNFGIDKKFFCDSGLVTILDSTIAQGSNISYAWNFGDGTISTEANPSTHLYNKPGWHPLKLTVKTSEGCIDSLAIRPGVKIGITPRIHISGDSVACVNTVMQSTGLFDTKDSSDITWAWILPDGSTSSLQAPPQLVFNTPGTYPMRAIASTSDGCADTAYKTVSVHPKPTATADFPSTITTQIGYPVKLEGTYPPNIKSYVWQPAEGLSCTNCPFPFATPKFNTRYIVAYTDSNNCTNAATVQVIVLCKNANVFVPNTFSPNGDGRNDVFYVRGRGLDRVKSLRIFDRWGEVVFEKRDFPVNDPSVGWDGRYKGAAAKADVYVYQVEVFCENGEVIHFDGNVALIL